ncbi:hypothetical protein [Georgenia wangjunii]|uniref:hypothetical protein n=1 Tax=Georgenia wangjunii TaxID=3117730 RepID=UPI002F26ABF7
MSEAEGEARRAAAERRRQRRLDARAGVNTQSARYITYEGSEQGQEWGHPRDGSESYPAGWTVSHDGKAWASAEASNIDEPGVRAWVEVGELQSAEGSVSQEEA